MSLTETTETVTVDWSARLQVQLRYQFTKSPQNATPDELFRAAASVLRPRLVDGLLATAKRFQAADAKAVNYFSMEFLLGRSLSNNLHNLGLYPVLESAFA